MAGQISNYLREKLLNHSLGQGAFTMPTNIYMGLFVGDPTDAGLFTDEVNPTGSGYARVEITALLGLCDPILGIENDTSIVFPTAITDWGAITHTALFDSATPGAGNMLYYGTLDFPSYIFATETFQYKISRYKLTIN